MVINEYTHVSVEVSPSNADREQDEGRQAHSPSQQVREQREYVVLVGWVCPVRKNEHEDALGKKVG